MQGLKSFGSVIEWNSVIHTHNGWHTKSCTLRITKTQYLSDLLKALEILSDTAVRKSAVDQEDLKPYWQSEKSPHFSRWVFKDFTNHRKKSNRIVVFSSRPFPSILKYWDHQWDLPKIWKQDSFRHILKSSASMYESSGS